MELKEDPMLRAALIPIAAALAVCLPGTMLLAGSSGPQRIPTVAEILKNPKDESFVRLRGTIIRQVGPKHYLFSDGTAQIGVKIKPKRFPSQPVDDRTPVEITCEVDQGLHKAPELDVASVQILPGGAN